MKTQKTITHEEYIKSIKNLICEHASEEDREKLDKIKLVYGAGHSLQARGITIYNRWKHEKHDQHTDLVEICAMGEENLVQLAGTTVHELAHVLSGAGTGHNQNWKLTCDRLGLRKAMAAGMRYHLANFAPWLRFALAALPTPNDGKPTGHDPLAGFAPGAGLFTHTRGCTLGFGTRGGTSRGKGSGSRLRLYECACVPPVKVRVSSDMFLAHCDRCGSAFNHKEKEGDSR